jgi:signal transduction histidine kinase
VLRQDGDLGAVLAMSRAAVTPAPLPKVLATIASHAAGLVAAQFASVLLLDGHGQLRFVAGHGLSAEYGQVFTRAEDGMPVVIAMRTRRAVVIADVEVDPLMAKWRHVSRREGYRSAIALPLVVNDAVIGGLVVYRRRAGTWSVDDRDRLDLIAGHVASAVRTAQLLDDQKYRLTALGWVVRGLREQTQAHVRRLQRLLELLEDQESTRARRFIADLESEHHESNAAVHEHVENRILAGLLLAETSIAHQKGIRLTIDRRSRLGRLPSRLGEAEAISVVGNLLDNAFDAVAGLPRTRRRVTLLLRDEGARTVVRVRDWGIGLQGRDGADLVEHGFTTKPNHSGAGLGLVSRIADAAGGTLTIEQPNVGATFEVAVPNG